MQFLISSLASHARGTDMAYSAITSLGGPPSPAVYLAEISRRHVTSLSSFSPAVPLSANALSKPISMKHPRDFRPTAAAEIEFAVLQDVGATAFVIAGSYSLVSTFDNLTRSNIIEQKLSRKIVHILSGLLFMASWPIFSTSTGARYFASVVPSINCLRLLMNGLSLASDEGLLTSLSREGKPEELLRGPLYYVLILIICAIVFWRESPVGIISLAMMCGGDGIADIMGRRFGSLKLPYNLRKSWVGSISMFLFGFLVSVGMLYYFMVLGCIQLEWIWTLQRIAFVSFVATVVESLPISGIVDDNISVPLVSMVTAILVFGY